MSIPRLDYRTPCHRELIDFRVDGHIATLTLCHPPVNTMSIAMAHRLGHLVDLCETNEQVRAVIITGCGDRAFCAGSDISEFPELLGPGQAVHQKLRPQNSAFSALAALPKPTVAALQASAFGGGVEVALCCDLIVADRDIELALPETNIGVFPSSGGSFRTVRRIGPARTKELIFLAGRIDASTAREWGLVNRVTEPGTALTTAQALALQLAQRPSGALRLAKSLINAASTRSDDDMLPLSLIASDEAFSSGEAREGTAAFLAHRSPDFHPAVPADTPITTAEEGTA